MRLLITRPAIRAHPESKIEACRVIDGYDIRAMVAPWAVCLVRTSRRRAIGNHDVYCRFTRRRAQGAFAESFFHSLKVEAIHGERFTTRESMRQAVFEYIETDYNPVRLHSTNGFLSPIEFEAHFKQTLAS